MFVFNCKIPVEVLWGRTVSNLSCPGGDRTHSDGTTQIWEGHVSGLLRVARGFGPGGRLVLATGSPGDNSNGRGVERRHGPLGCVSDSVDTQVWALCGLLRVACSFGPA